MRKVLFLIAVLLLVSPVFAASVYYGGFEDTAGSGGPEKNGDYNDIIFKLTGQNLSLVSSDGLWFDMVAPTEGGSPFWDNFSSDGPQRGAGFCLTNSGACVGQFPQPNPTLQYLAKTGGGQPLDFSFTTNDPFQATFLLEVTALASVNSIGWYEIGNPSNSHVIFSGANTAGASGTFTPTASFGLFATNGSQVFYGQTALGSVDKQQQHIAMFREFQQNDPTTPEPATLAIGGLGLAVLGLLRAKRSK